MPESQGIWRRNGEEVLIINLVTDYLCFSKSVHIPVLVCFYVMFKLALFLKRDSLPI